MDDFTMHLTFDTTAERLYEAIVRADRWWSRHVRLTREPGGVMTFDFPSAGFYATVRIETMDPGRHVEWACLDAKHPEDSGFSDLKDWVGTRMRFDVDEVPPGKARLTFVHRGLVPQLECHGACVSAWSYYLNGSLRALVETGQGKPFDDGAGGGGGGGGDAA